MHVGNYAIAGGFVVIVFKVWNLVKMVYMFRCVVPEIRNRSSRGVPKEGKG